MKAIFRSLEALPLGGLARHRDVALAVLVAALIGMMILPLPALLIDVLLATNLALAALILGEAVTGQTTINGSWEKTIEVTATDTLKTVQQKINDQAFGVFANIINDGTGLAPYRLSLNSRNSGINGRVVFDAGATRTARPYFVMELVRGIKITDYCNQCRLTIEERLVIFTQVWNTIVPVSRTW